MWTKAFLFLSLSLYCDSAFSQIYKLSDRSGVDFPAEAGEPMQYEIRVLYKHDGYQQTACKSEDPAITPDISRQACSHVSMHKSKKKWAVALAPVWEGKAYSGTYIRPALYGIPPQNLMTYRDYPKDALRNGWQGTVTVRFDVGSIPGKAQCTVAGTSGYSGLDQAVLRTMCTRAHFVPATLDGRPVPAVLFLSMRLYQGN